MGKVSEGKGRVGTVVFHAGDYWHGSIREGRIDFFDRLTRHLTGEGVATRLVALGGPASDMLLAEDHVNIIVGGDEVRGRNLLHTAPSHIWGFWYLDPDGIHWRSSLRRQEFDPDGIEAEAAEYFFNGVSGHMLRQNVSLSDQAPRVEGGLEPAAAAIHCQEIEAESPPSHFLTTDEMIRVTAEAAEGGIVYVKPHPKQGRVALRRIEALIAAHGNLRLTGASVHDLNDAARVVVTQNSAAGFEALMQRKPVITCGKCDFRHATLTPRSAGDLAEAVRVAPGAMAGFDYAKYLYWFLGVNCLEPQKDEFGERALKRIRTLAG